MSQQSDHLYEFGPFVIDEVKRLLLRDGEVVSLTSKGFDALLVLVARRGQVVSKDELMNRLWPDTVVEENNLTQQISMLRKALGERAGEHRYVVTVPGRGYSFVADVREPCQMETDLVVEQHTRSRITLDVEDGHAGELSHPETSIKYLPAVAAPARRWWNSRAAVFPASILFVGLALFAFWFTSRRAQSRNDGDNAHRKTVAVLPFRSLGGGPADDYLGTGMTDTLIAKLSNIRQISVRPTSAVMKYAGRAQDSQAAGRELGVDSVLEGTIQKTDERVRVTVQLVNVQDRNPLWAQSFDEKMTDIFAVQDAISEQVARAMFVGLDGDERRRLRTRETENVEAYQVYLRGRFFWNQRSAGGIRKGIEHFNRAIGLDPSYARAYAGLADSYIIAAYYGGQSRVSYESAREAATKALELDVTLAEAHASLAVIKANQDHDDAGAEGEFRRAVELNPDYATAHHWYSEYLAAHGREPEALAEITRAQELDPLSPVINTTLGERLYYARRYDEAVAQLVKTLEVAPDFGPAHYALGCAYEQKGMYREAISELLKIKGVSPSVLASLAHAYAVAGRKEEARKILDELLAGGPSEPYDVALVYQGLGERQKAFDWLQKIQDKKGELGMLLKSDPRLDALRSDPRFREIIGA